MFHLQNQWSEPEIGYFLCDLDYGFLRTKFLVLHKLMCPETCSMNSNWS